MHPSLFEIVARQHIEELHREAALQRLSASRPKYKGPRPRAFVRSLRRAPAH